MTEPGGVLVVGYGNALRTDDGLGWQVAVRAAADPRLVDATVMRCHQLTPELAPDIGRASLVVFVDAGHGPAGALSIRAIDPVAATDGAPSLTHHLDAAVLVDLAAALYGRRAPAVEVSVGVVSTEPGERLSPIVEAMVPDVVDAVVLLAAGAGLAGPRADANPVGQVGHA